jgi:protoheme ferro-lyase
MNSALKLLLISKLSRMSYDEQFCVSIAFFLIILFAFALQFCRFYVGFRYAHPLATTALEDMARDGVQRAIAFSQYPQWSCTTAGSSMNHLNLELSRLGLKDKFKWSVIDRWPQHPGFIKTVAKKIKQCLVKDFPKEYKDDVIILFSAHSLPNKTVNKGGQKCSIENRLCAVVF